MGRQLGIAIILVVFFMGVFFASYFFSAGQQNKLGNMLATRENTPDSQQTSNVVLPQPYETPAETGSAVPVAILDMTGQNTNKIRVYTLTADKNTFSFTKITVRAGDVVRINAQSLDKPYDFSLPGINIRQEFAPADAAKRIEFQISEPGTYPFFCQRCRTNPTTPSVKTEGIIVVLPKS